MAARSAGANLKDIKATLMDILKGIAEGLMTLPDTPDFVGCVFSGLTAKKFFSGLTKQNISSPVALADTIHASKQYVLPVVQGCLDSADDLLVDANEAIQLYVNFDTMNLLKVLDTDAEFIGRSIATAVEYFLKKDTVSGTAQLTIMLEKIVG